MTKRLDQYLAHMGLGSRSALRETIRAGRVTVDGRTVTDEARKVDGEAVALDGAPVVYREYFYVMLHKPAGVVTATQDSRAETVLDLLSPPHSLLGLTPAGRLDKDTTGLLILTNDGGFVHRTLSPKGHADKVYEASLAREVTGADVAAFGAGMLLAKDTPEEFRCLPAELQPLPGRRARVILREGKFHQVKRMFLAAGNEVLSLKRLAFAGLWLDESLREGEYRDLTEDEMRIIDPFRSRNM